MLVCMVQAEDATSLIPIHFLPASQTPAEQHKPVPYNTDLIGETIA